MHISFADFGVYCVASNLITRFAGKLLENNRPLCVYIYRELSKKIWEDMGLQSQSYDRNSDLFGAFRPSSSDWTLNDLLRSKGQTMAALFGGKFTPGDPKTPAALAFKEAHKANYAGNEEYRGRLVIAASQVPALLRYIHAQKDIINIDDRVTNPDPVTGYTAIHFDQKLSPGVCSEIQVHILGMEKAHDATRGAMREVNLLTRYNKDSPSDLPPEKAARVEELNAQRRAVYAQAREACGLGHGRDRIAENLMRVRP